MQIEKDIELFIDIVGKNSEKTLTSILEMFIEAVTGDTVSNIKLGLSCVSKGLDLSDQIFLKKIERYINGVMQENIEQIQLASYINDSDCWKERCYKLLSLLDKTSYDKKIYYYSNLTRGRLVFNLDVALYERLMKVIDECTVAELEYFIGLKDGVVYKNDGFISWFEKEGLMKHVLDSETQSHRYSVSLLGKALKYWALEYNEMLDDNEIKNLKYQDLVDIPSYSIASDEAFYNRDY